MMSFNTIFLPLLMILSAVLGIFAGMAQRNRHHERQVILDSKRFLGKGFLRHAREQI